MPIAFRFLIVLLAAIPALALAEDSLVQHAAAIAAAIILTTAALDRQADITSVGHLLRRFSFAIVFPMLWMTLQMVPLPIASLANSIWATASSALGEASTMGHISIAPGATLKSLMLYLTMLALTISTTIVARERQRAETLLLVLGTVTTFMSAEALLGRLDAFRGIIPAAAGAATTFVAMAALAALASGAIIMMVVDRSADQRDSAEPFALPFSIRLVPSLCGLAISLAAISSLAFGGVLAVTASGLAAMLFIVIVRRVGLRSLPSVILFLALVATAAALIVPRLQNRDFRGIEQFATASSVEALTQAQRTLADAPWLGNGVGTYSFLAPSYQDFGSAPTREAPSTAVLVAIEWGKPALVILAALAVQLFVFVFRGAIRRGRDAFFASAAAGAVLVTLGEAFCDPSLLTTTVQMVVATMVGLGLSQSVGSSSKPK